MTDVASSPDVSPADPAAILVNEAQQQQGASGGEEMSPEAQPRMTKAKEFLGNPSVRQTPLSRRVNFLKSKGLSLKEIHAAFEAVGQPKKMEELEEAANKVSIPANSTARPADTASSGPPTRPYQQQQELAHSPPKYYPPQHTMAPPMVPQKQGDGWKDYYIAGTLVLGVGVAIQQAVSHFLDIRWKDTSYPNNIKTERKTRFENRDLPPLPELTPQELIAGPATPYQEQQQQLTTKLATLELDVTETKNRVTEIKANEEKLNELVKASEHMLKKGAETNATLTKIEGKIRMQDRLVERIKTMEESKKQADEELRSLKASIAQLSKSVSGVNPQQQDGANESSETVADQDPKANDENLAKPSALPIAPTTPTPIDGASTAGAKCESKTSLPVSSTSAPAAPLPTESPLAK
ncbi:peroxin 14 [Diplonema papillatum]|nr:peroxin 14 [Diplonema papillatum]